MRNIVVFFAVWGLKKLLQTQTPLFTACLSVAVFKSKGKQSDVEIVVCTGTGGVGH